MKSNKIYFGIIIMMLIGIIIYTVYGLAMQGQTEEPYSCSVVLDNSNSDRWISFKKGLEQAAGDYNVNLNIVSTGKLSGSEEEIQLISRELKNGAVGLIVQICEDDNFWSVADDTIKRAYIVLAETDLRPEKSFSSVTPDWKQIGITMAQTVLQKETGNDAAEGENDEIRIGVICENESLLSTQQVMKAFQETLRGTNTQILWTVTDCSTESLQEQINGAPVDVIVSMENDDTEAAVDLLAEKGALFRLYGIGCSEKLVYHLDEGLIQTLIVPNDFLMGYQSVLSLVSQMENHSSMTDHEKTDFYVVDKENLYDPKMQRILFPTVQ